MSLARQLLRYEKKGNIPFQKNSKKDIPSIECLNLNNEKWYCMIFCFFTKPGNSRSARVIHEYEINFVPCGYYSVPVDMTVFQYWYLRIPGILAPYSTCSRKYLCVPDNGIPRISRYSSQIGNRRYCCTIPENTVGILREYCWNILPMKGELQISFSCCNLNMSNLWF